MLSLSSDRYAAARSILLAQARPLERAAFLYEFEGGQPEAILSALAAFQNPDGGYGNALEPDFRLPASSALATSVALQILSRLPADAASAQAMQALSYLAGSYDSARQGWQKVPPAIADHPRAIWWEPEGPADVESNWANPGAELVGYLYEFSGSAASGLRGVLTEKSFAWLDAGPQTLEMHDLLCYLRLAQRLPGDLQAALYDRLDRQVREAVVTDPAKWAEYGLQPLQVAPSPDGRYASPLREAVEANLDHLLAIQGEDGAWNPSWAWGRYEDMWERARVEWQGVLTLENLRLLRAYGRVG